MWNIQELFQLNNKGGKTCNLKIGKRFEWTLYKYIWMTNKPMKNVWHYKSSQKMQIKSIRYYYIIIRMSKIFKTEKKERSKILSIDNDVENWNSHSCLWECNVEQPLWKTAWQFLIMLNMQSPHDSTIPFLGIYPRKMKCVDTKACMWMFRATLFIITQNWKLKCSSAGEWITNDGTFIQLNRTQQ